ERAPAVEELFSDGVHEATASYEQGNPSLDTEVSVNAEFGYRYTGRWHASANVFYNHVNDYIAALNTGRVFNEDIEAFENSCTAADEDECLPVYRYSQQDAVFYGYELEAGLPLPTPAGDRLELLVFTDYVRGEFDKTGDIPRLPPLRYGAALQWDWASVNSELRWTRAQEQDRPGINETATGGYTLIDASIDWVFWKHDDQQATWFIRGLNLLDDEVRNSVSYLRDIAPEAGRRFETGVRVQF
ncbi:MAG: TonB-dependent receptor, partial [Gammaproteobacteria bacterium]